jgi:hypothetical protein
MLGVSELKSENLPISEDLPISGAYWLPCQEQHFHEETRFLLEASYIYTQLSIIRGRINRFAA